MTLGQVAGLPRPTEGTFAQGFGLSVSAAVNARVPQVVEPVQAALATLGYRDPIQGCLHLAVDTCGLAPIRGGTRRPQPVPTTAAARRGVPDWAGTPEWVLDRITATCATSWAGAGLDPRMPGTCPRRCCGPSGT